MEYTKPELNQLGVAEGLILGLPDPGLTDNAGTTGPASFEFEE